MGGSVHVKETANAKSPETGTFLRSSKKANVAAEKRRHGLGVGPQIARVWLFLLHCVAFLYMHKQMCFDIIVPALRVLSFSFHRKLVLLCVLP